jgi:hypothetical protein
MTSAVTGSNSLGRLLAEEAAAGTTTAPDWWDSHFPSFQEGRMRGGDDFWL